jgi:hypothetical protein
MKAHSYLDALLLGSVVHILFCHDWVLCCIYSVNSQKI